MKVDMTKKFDVKLERVHTEDIPLFIEKLQEAFSVTVKEKFGVCDPIPTEDDIKSSIYEKNAETYHIVLNGQRVGGTVLIIDKETQHNSLDLFFISPKYHSHGIGLSAWQAIESKYPDTVVWQTITPYFEERNIHFYVNKCGFHIVEFFNKFHIDPTRQQRDNEENEMIPDSDTYFRFEKVMRNESKDM